MIIVHDTGYGVVEVHGEFYLHRMDLSRFKPLKFMQLAVRTWEIYGKRDSGNRPIPAKNVRCILALNDALDKLIAAAEPCVLVLMVDEPNRSLYKLKPNWVRTSYYAVTKSASLDNEVYLNFLKECFSDDIK